MSKEKPTIKETVNIDLSEKTGVGVDPKDAEKFLDTLTKQADKLFNRHSKYRGDNNETAQALLIYLDKYPELFANEYGAINRDMLKWSLQENIKTTQALLDKVKAIETAFNLPLHPQDD